MFFRHGLPHDGKHEVFASGNNLGPTCVGAWPGGWWWWRGVGSPKFFSFFLPLPLPISIFCLVCGSSRGIVAPGRGHGPPNLGSFCASPRRPERPPEFHRMTSCCREPSHLCHSQHYRHSIHSSCTCTSCFNSCFTGLEVVRRNLVFVPVPVRTQSHHAVLSDLHFLSTAVIRRRRYDNLCSPVLNFILLLSNRTLFPSNKDTVPV